MKTSIIFSAILVLAASLPVMSQPDSGGSNSGPPPVAPDINNAAGADENVAGRPAAGNFAGRRRHGRRGMMPGGPGYGTQNQNLPPQAGSDNAALPGAGGQKGGGAQDGALGVMSDAERAARRQEHYRRMMKRFDLNGDGSLDASEKAKLDAFMQERRPQRGMRRGPAGRFGGARGPGQQPGGQNMPAPNMPPSSNAPGSGMPAGQ